MEKKTEILKIALKEFAKNGYENTSLEVIAKKCNITKPAIYYHFKSKQQLYSQIFIDKFNLCNLKLSSNLEENIKNHIDIMSQILCENFSKLFIKELSNELNNLNDEAFNKVTNSIKTLTKILKETNINPFFIQTLIVSSLTTYYNSINLRKRISKEINVEDEFNIKEEITTLILNYIKEKE